VPPLYSASLLRRPVMRAAVCAVACARVSLSGFNSPVACRVRVRPSQAEAQDRGKSEVSLRDRLLSDIGRVHRECGGACARVEEESRRTAVAVSKLTAEVRTTFERVDTSVDNRVAALSAKLDSVVEERRSLVRTCCRIVVAVVYALSYAVVPSTAASCAFVGCRASTRCTLLCALVPVRL
jgi:hypothetical protein